MPKVHCVNEARAFAVKIDMEGATPIWPLKMVVVQFPRPAATDELEIPPAPLSLALHPDVAIDLALDLYQAASAQKEP
ncbi:MAG: hypothetical protein OXF88_20120 [Rhodobacteraceae bacterium]|nr:hypothetical protein [Paracoccaceae bacterium]